MPATVTVPDEAHRPKGLPGLIFSVFTIDRRSPVPLHRQVYHDIREAILARRLTSGTRLPSSRDLATQLGVSRNTVVSAFEQIFAEGYVEGRAGAGTHVAFTLPVESPVRASALLEPAGNGIPSRAATLSQRGTLVAQTPMTWTCPSPKLHPVGKWLIDQLRSCRSRVGAAAVGVPSTYSVRPVNVDFRPV